MANEKNIVEGEFTTAVRIIGWGVAGLVALGLILGLGRWIEHVHQGRLGVVDGLIMMEVVFASALVLLGSIVEGFGYGLSLGTQWPYTRNIVVLMLRGDPEAAHRLLATLVGLVALVLAIIHPTYETINGLVLIVVTALFGMGTLYVLAGKVPSIVHGTHGLLAYFVFMNYLLALVYPDMHLWPFLRMVIPTHALLFAIFMGGMVTGGRGFGTAIAPFLHPQKPAQWIFVVHGFAALLVIGTLGWMSAVYPVAFFLALFQAVVGFFLFYAVNLKPKTPGAMVPFHQMMVLLITTAIVMRWHW